MDRMRQCNMSSDALHTVQYLFREPRTEERHVERVCVRVNRPEGIGTDGADQSVNTTRQLIANCEQHKEKQSSSKQAQTRLTRARHSLQ